MLRWRRMNDSDLIARKHILLTGAGFTRNFGGPLADDVWASIVSHPKVQRDAALRRYLLAEGMDFESVWHVVQYDSAWQKSARDALTVAVTEVFEEIDRTRFVEMIGPGRPYPIEFTTLQRQLIGRFEGDPTTPGLFFTLNQDLFIERMYYNGPTPVMPGLQQYKGIWFSPTNANANRGTPPLTSLPSKEQLTGGDKLLKGSPFYFIKLHGSWDWRSSDGRECMVLGRGKDERIADEPLLALYFGWFTRAIQRTDVRLLCIGYGFRDEHINAVLADGAKRFGLRIWIVSPEPPSELKRRLSNDGAGFGQEIWSALGGHFRCDLQTLFPAGQRPSQAWHQLEASFWR